MDLHYRFLGILWNDKDGLRRRSVKQKSLSLREAFCDPAGARTQDPDIKSVVLYQLSYRINSLPLTDEGFRLGSQK